MADPSKFTDRAAHVAGQARQKAGPLKDKATGIAGQARQKAGPLASQAREKAGPLAAQAKEKAGPIAAQAMQKAGPIAAQAKEKAGPLAAQAKEKAGPIAAQAMQKAGPLASQARNTAAHHVGTVAGGVDKLTKGKYSDKIQSLATLLGSVLQTPGGQSGAHSAAEPEAQLNGAAADPPEGGEFGGPEDTEHNAPYGDVPPS